MIAQVEDFHFLTFYQRHLPFPLLLFFLCWICRPHGLHVLLFSWR
nr:uncharacterized protein CTRU02_09460 [Colletotrichum truncatum]KAF6788652.1 hypothetical protein CTRU02_09460 [Colletotrichum truncatum]